MLIFQLVSDQNPPLFFQQAEQWLGCAMTYTLFEWAKENAEDLMAEQTEAQMTVRVSAASRNCHGSFAKF